MQKIIPPVDRDQLISELTKDKFLRKTNYDENEIYIITNNDSPFLMKEIGRLRELTFREAGGGTGNDSDIDKFDISDNPYKQLIVWSPVDKEIIGGYRFFICDKSTIKNEGYKNLATARLFKFSDKFINEYLPYTIELGRSFLQPQYQSTAAGRKAVFALDNLWDGLGGLWVNNTESRYFFGKVTMYTHFNREARNLLMFFMNKHFRDKENLVRPYNPLDFKFEEEKLSQLFNKSSYREDYKILSKNVRALGENIPPLINAYMNLSPTLKLFGTAINPHFGEVEETSIMVTIKDIYPTKATRHVLTYNQ